MTRVRAQAATRSVTLESIVGSSGFARGLRETRQGLPLDSFCNDWNYVRGRQFGRLVPMKLALRVGGKLNPKALELAREAFSRGDLI
jgi:hypothetical protein